ncbi:MAG: hypothetical protein ABIQ95_15015 [Bdellovibrionia bacterium]
MTSKNTEIPKNNSTQFFVDNEVIVLTNNGIWIADGTEISHEPTRRLFARSLVKDEKGYHLQIGKETKAIRVEDTAYFIHRIDGSSEEGYKLWINDETQETLDPTTLKYQPARMTCKIKKGAEDAKFLHSAYFDLLKTLKQDAMSYYLEFWKSDNRLRINLSSAKV